MHAYLHALMQAMQMEYEPGIWPTVPTGLALLVR